MPSNTNPVDLYNNVYSGFASDAETAVRRQTYGEDIGQSSWMTASEWLGFADLLGVTDGSICSYRQARTSGFFERLASNCWASMTLPVAQPKFPSVGTTHANSSGKLSY